MKTAARIGLGLVALALLSPLGLVLPERFKAGSAWGEWGADEMGRLVGYVPQGLQRLSEVWHAPLPDYAFRGWEGKGLAQLSAAYVASAFVGIGAVALLAWLLGKWLSKKDE